QLNMASSVLVTIYNSLSLGNFMLLFLLLLMLHYLMVFYEFRNMPPGPRLATVPVLGNVFSLDATAENLSDTFQSLRERYGRIFALKLGSYKCVMASSPGAVNEMLVKKSVEYAGRPLTYALYNQSLVRLPGIPNQVEGHGHLCGIKEVESSYHADISFSLKEKNLSTVQNRLQQSLHFIPGEIDFSR
ncbi:hypothetical protein ACROYT_G000955, partial [Oculina patagonica]